MKKTILSIVLVVLGTFLFVAASGCDGDHNSTDEAHQHEADGHQHEHQQVDKEKQTFTGAQQKTASGKWKANPETTAGIESMMNMVGSFSAEDAVTHCGKLQRVLDATFQRILQQCTMEGEAHEALHEYLLPLKEKIGAISPEDATQCTEKVREISEYLATYYEQFE